MGDESEGMCAKEILHVSDAIPLLHVVVGPWDLGAGGSLEMDHTVKKQPWKL